MNGLITIINQIQTFVDCRELLKPQKKGLGNDPKNHYLSKFFYSIEVCIQFYIDIQMIQLC